MEQRGRIQNTQAKRQTSCHERALQDRTCRNMRKNTYSARTLQKRRHRKRIRDIKRSLAWMVGMAAVIFILYGMEKNSSFRPENRKQMPDQTEHAGENKNAEDLQEAGAVTGNYPPELLEMLDKNEETYEFVKNFTNKSRYQGKSINLEGEFESGKVPLLLQWDMRWGYDSYGQDMIAVAGCGPACMTMAYLYLTEDISMNPRKMAEFANENGFYTAAGTSWSFFTDGAKQLGLAGKEITLSESAIRRALDGGSVVICSMRPGDFTTTGHFILIRGWDKNGFYVNDPNSKKNSGKQWSFEKLQNQIKCLWEIKLSSG